MSVVRARSRYAITQVTNSLCTDTMPLKSKQSHYILLFGFLPGMVVKSPLPVFSRLSSVTNNMYM